MEQDMFYLFFYSFFVLLDTVMKNLRVSWVITTVCVCVCVTTPSSPTLCLCFPVSCLWWLTLGKCISAVIGGVTMTPPRGKTDCNHTSSTAELEEGNASTHTYSTRRERPPFKDKALLSSEWRQFRNMNTCNTFPHSRDGMPAWVSRFLTK